MAIRLDPNSSIAASDATVTPAAPPTPRATSTTRPSTSSTAEKPAVESQTAVPIAGILEANVTFRRDDRGQIYYVITDAQSGKELREVPPAEVRKVGEGIEDFLKQEEAKATPHLDSKA
jgi:hypothetical protein